MRSAPPSFGRAASATLLFGWLFALSASATGCPQTTCEETATCPDPGGGSSANDSGSVTAADAAALTDGARACEGAENCTNGIDDDCNGAIDCADPACTAGFECVTVAPAGWSGPGILSEGSALADAATTAACPSAFATDAFDGVSNPSAPAASCACTCGAPTGVVCAANASFFYDSACANLCASDALTLDTCVATCSGAQTMTVTETVSQAGSCAPQAKTQIPPVTWGNAGRVCAPATLDAPGGCNAGQACVAKSPAPFDSASCIWQSGDVPCPDASATRHLYFTPAAHTIGGGSGDTRGCSPCTCGATQGATCAGTSVTVYSDVACTATPSTAAGDGTCVSAPAGAHGVEATTSTTSAQGSCTPSAVTSSGSFTPSGATTICCGE